MTQQLPCEVCAGLTAPWPEGLGWAEGYSKCPACGNFSFWTIDPPEWDKERWEMMNRPFQSDPPRGSFAKFEAKIKDSQS